MPNYNYDLLVIGAGSGGVRASRMAARHNKRVAVVEVGALGGTCVNVGCVPKKIFYYGAQFAHAFSDSRNYGWTSDAPQFNWPTLRDNKTQEITRLNGVYHKLLEQAGVTILHGFARVVDAHTVQIGDIFYTAKYILIATGSVPQLPTFPGNHLANISDAVFSLKEFPKHVVIVGGGYIACEFASMFAGLGVEVTQLYRGELFLRYFDKDVRLHIADELRKQNIDLRFNTDLTTLEKTATGLRAHTNTGAILDTDFVLYAAGRTPNTKELGLEGVGVTLDEKGAILVDEYFQTAVPSIYAIGDVIDEYQLTPVALAQAMAFVKTICENNPTMVDYQLIPTAVFTNPTIASVGLTEEQARDRYDQIKIYKSKFRALKHTITKRDKETLIKLIVDEISNRVVGIHMVGEDAGEIIQGFAVALKAGATKELFDATIGIHPTIAEEFVTMR